MGSGNDTVTGSQYNEELRGGAGNDTLNGGSGDDVLIGGEGSDMFVFSDTWGKNVIADFVSGKDKIDLSDLDLYDDDKDAFPGQGR